MAEQIAIVDFVPTVDPYRDPMPMMDPLPIVYSILI